MKTIYEYHNNEDNTLVSIKVNIDNPKFELESPNKIFPISYSFNITSEKDSDKKTINTNGVINDIKELNETIKEVGDLINGKRYKTVVRVKGNCSYIENDSYIPKQVAIGIISDNILFADKKGYGKFSYIIKGKNVVQDMLLAIFNHLKMITNA